MKKKFQTQFSARQYMLSRDFELYYYSDTARPQMLLHSHGYYEFYFFLEGDVSIQIGKDVFPLTAGDLIVIPPGLSHVAVIHSMTLPYRRFVFWISQEFCRHLFDLSPDYGYLMQLVQTRKDYIFHNDKITFNSIQSKILRLLEEMQTDRFCREPQIALCVNDLILHLNRLVYERNHSEPKQETESLYQSLCGYIEDHIDEDLSLDRLSGEFYVSKYHISHVFKENLGLSIHQYITKKRLSHCREAILGGLDVTRAYQTWGFGDYSSFYRAFKKEYGLSPKDFRDSSLLSMKNEENF